MRQMITRRQTLLYGVFCAVFFALFAFVAADSLLNPRGPFFVYRPLSLCLAALGCGGALWGAWQVWRRLPVPGARLRRFGPAALLLLCLAAQLLCGFALRVGEGADWDFGIVLGAAIDSALHGTLPGDYFGRWGNNSPLYVGMALLLRIPAALWGTREACYNFMVGVNCLLANASLWLLYGAARRLFGQRRAAFCLCCSAVLVPFWAYLPIVYTDTLTLVFPIAAMVLWLDARALLTQLPTRGAAEPPSAPAQPETEGAAPTQLWRGAVWRLALLGALCGLGGTLKITVVIALVAVGIDAALALPWRRALAAAAVCVAACALCMALLGACVKHTPLLPPYSKDLAVPYTHWVMMGLHGDGGYYNPDYDLTMRADTYEARVALNLAEIERRIAEYGPAGLLRHAADKLSFTWGDGMYYAPYKLSLYPLQTTPLHLFLLPGSPGYGLACYLFTGLQLCLLAGMSVGAWRAWREKNHSATVLRVAVFGLVLFLLVWETRSRYLVNFLPLLALCACSALAPCPAPAACPAAKRAGACLERYRRKIVPRERK